MRWLWALVVCVGCNEPDRVTVDPLCEDPDLICDADAGEAAAEDAEMDALGRDVRRDPVKDAGLATERDAALNVDVGAAIDAARDVAPELDSRVMEPPTDWIRIPAGMFEMGGPEGSAQPARRVVVEAFEMARTEVTVGEYADCVSAGVCTAPRMDNRAGCTAGQALNLPINCVTWHQATAYSVWMGARLATEAEWEYAARGAGRFAPFPWGQGEGCDRLNRAGCGGAPTAVCSKPAGRSAQGVCDLAGNVWEWVEDCWHDDYVGAPGTGEAWSVACDSGARVHRGGSYFHEAELAHVHRRSRNDTQYSSPRVGIRLVR